MDPKSHWDGVYASRDVTEVGWYQPEPKVSLDLITQAADGRRVSVVDVGGGASVLVDRLLDRGFTGVAVMDIAEYALEKARDRLGDRAWRVRWIVGDVTGVEGVEQYDVWHDRAVFHFLTSPDDRQKYAALARRSMRQGGHLIIATFAPDGPDRCSGLPVCRYTAQTLAAEFVDGFELVKEVRDTHTTPSGKSQAFTYAMFRRA